MPRLDTFTIKLTTGDSPLKGPLKFIINGFPLEFDDFLALGKLKIIPRLLLSAGADHGLGNRFGRVVAVYVGLIEAHGGGLGEGWSRRKDEGGKDSNWCGWRRVVHVILS